MQRRIKLRGSVGRTARRVFLAVCLGLVATATSGAGPETLRESPRADSTHVLIELKAEGLFRPGLPLGESGDEVRMPKPLALEVKTRLDFRERRLPHGRASRARAVRWVSQAASAVNGEIRPTASRLRSGHSLLLAEADEAGRAVVVSLAGPMTRAELELVQGVGDPLALGGLIPETEVAAGQSWPLPADVTAALSSYDVIGLNTLRATLESVDAVKARISLKGEIKGSALGGPGTMQCEGFYTLDRVAGLVDRLEVSRNESRQAGPVEAGLDVKSTLLITRQAVPVAPELTDSALAGRSLEVTPARQLVQLVAPGGKYNLLHDRRWHIYWDDPKLMVLKRLDGGRVVAQCNLAAGPFAGRGKHQDPGQFRDEIRRSLKDRFIQFLGAGEVDGDPAGGFRYKVGVQGRHRDLGVIWLYYLLASPAGDQVLGTFTLAEEDAKAFGDQDIEMIGSLQWTTDGTDAR